MTLPNDNLTPELLLEHYLKDEVRFTLRDFVSYSRGNGFPLIIYDPTLSDKDKVYMAANFLLLIEFGQKNSSVITDLLALSMHESLEADAIHLLDCSEGYRSWLQDYHKDPNEELKQIAKVAAVVSSKHLNLLFEGQTLTFHEYNMMKYLSWLTSWLMDIVSGDWETPNYFAKELAEQPVPMNIDRDLYNQIALLFSHLPHSDQHALNFDGVDQHTTYKHYKRFIKNRGGLLSNFIPKSLIRKKVSNG